MTPEKDLAEAAALIDQMAAQAITNDQSDAVLLYALARRLRVHAKQTELNDCKRSLFRCARRVQDLTELLITHNVQVPPQAPTAGRQPTPPPQPAGAL